jgi:peptidoglycan pentaglycine glycine transferase (the first glycine)
MEKSFLQSKEWLDFQKSLGRKTWDAVGISIIKHNLPLKKSYLYSARLRPSDFDGQARWGKFLTRVKEIAKQENAIFFKIEPENEVNLKSFGFKKSHNIQPKKTLILDISESEQELLSQMHYKTRYNIQLAIKKGVKTYCSSPKTQNFNDFWRLMEETTKRDKFRPHPKEYYRKMLEIPGVELFIASYRDKIIAANIVVFFEKTAIYLHGASDYEHRNLMAPHLLQWEQIKEAKKHGCIEYDFWGIDEQKWPGVTRFKKGFAGKEINYLGAYDLVFQSAWYWIYEISRKIL